MGNKWTRWEQKYEKPRAYYQYSVANGVSPAEAAKACDYAKATGQSPKDVTPKSQMSSCSSSSSSSSCSSSSSTSSSNSSNSTTSSTASCNKSSSIFNDIINGKKNVNPNNIVRTGDPEQDAKNFAKKMGISVSQAKTILKNLFGAPQQNQANSTNYTNNIFGGNNILTFIINMLQRLMSNGQY